jgi:hypothetical protein
LRGGVLERFLYGGKSRRLRVVISENSYTDRIAHLAILVEKFGRAEFRR